MSDTSSVSSYSPSTISSDSGFSGIGSVGENTTNPRSTLYNSPSLSSSSSSSSSCSSWLIPLLVITGLCLLSYCWYCYTCTSDSCDSSDSSDSSDSIDDLDSSDDDITVSGLTGGKFKSGVAHELTYPEFQKLLREKKPFIVAFMADWCGHCKILKPQYHQAALQLSKPLFILRVEKIQNEQQKKKVMDTFNIRGYPTVAVIKNGKVLVEYHGERTAAGIAKFANEHLKY